MSGREWTKFCAMIAVVIVLIPLWAVGSVVAGRDVLDWWVESRRRRKREQ